MEFPGPEERWYTLAGQRYGPFYSQEEAEDHLLERIRAWRDRAEALGGWAWRRSHLELVVTLPDEVEVAGGEPLTPWFRKHADDWWGGRS